jgi:diguanylate cyclase (GGDEF)-like protein
MGATTRSQHSRVGSVLGGNERSGAGQMLDERYEGGWLCPTKGDRARLTDMSPAVRRARIMAGLFAGIGVVAMGPWIGWWPLVVFAVVPVPLLVLDRFLATSTRPERLVAASLILHTTLILVGIAITVGTRSPLLPWVAIPVVTAAARFRLPVFLIGALLATGGLIASCAVGSPHGLLQHPAPLIAIVVLLGALVVAQQPLLDAEIRWRHDAVLDPLTGLLNRQGLERRFREVSEQARMTKRSVSLVIFDLDEFKAFNDEHGHARGDAVLTDVAYVLRKELRSFELLYRIGGEELLLILAGADLEVACKIAEQCRGAIEESRPAGLPVTASFGVCSAEGLEIELESMFAAADRCLYEAKRAGRNRVASIAIGDSAPSLVKENLRAVG